MSELNINESISLEVDKIQDGIKFNLLLFNEGKYDRTELRTVIRNTGIKLDITNQLDSPIEIKNIYFGIIENSGLTPKNCTMS